MKQNFTIFYYEVVLVLCLPYINRNRPKMPPPPLKLCNVGFPLEWASTINEEKLKFFDKF